MFRTSRQDSGRRRIRHATRVTSTLSATAMFAGALVASTAPVFVADGVASAAPPPCTVSQPIIAGEDDAFGTGNGAEPSEPSTLHESFWLHPNSPGLPLKDYDERTDDAVLAETFEGFSVPAGHQICGATLDFKARSISSTLPTNDSIGVHFIVDNDGTPERSGASDTWAENIATYKTATPLEYEGSINLGALDSSGLPEPITVLEQMRHYEYLDVWIQDDTEVDFLRLTISTSPLVTIVKQTNGVDMANVPFGAPLTWTYTITNHAENPAIVTDLVDSEEGAIEIASCEPGNGVIEPGGSMTCTLTGTATSADYCNDATASGMIEGYEGGFEVTDRSCYVGGACEGNLITNPLFDDVKANPNTAPDEDISLANAWGPIWHTMPGVSTGDLFAPGGHITPEPAPATGNFATFWAVHQKTSKLIFREGIMNRLAEPLVPRTGTTKLSFTTAQHFADAENSVIGVYGVLSFEGVDALGTKPSSPLLPKNVDLFGETTIGATKYSNVVKLASVELQNTNDEKWIGREATIDTAALPTRVERVFFTHDDDVTLAAGSFVAVDNFCMPTPTHSGEPDEAAAVAMLAEPDRLMDTRPIGQTADGIAAKEGRLGSAANNPFENGVYRLPLAGRSGVEVGAKTAVLNVTVVSPDGPGYVTVFPCSGETPTPPNASSVNFGAGAQVVANNVVAGLDANGRACIFSSVEAHILVDLGGFFPLDSGYETAVPARFADTRANANPDGVVPGGQVRNGPGAVRDVLEVDVARIAVEELDDDVDWGEAVAVTLNIAAVRPQGSGYLTVYPCGTERPNASSVNFREGVNVANGVVVGLSEGDGTVCVFGSAATDVIIDITGSFPAESGFTPIEPARYLDTRTNAGAATIDGKFLGGGVVEADRATTLQLGEREGIPGDVDAVALNVTAIRPGANGSSGFPNTGFISVTPGACVKGTVPGTSNLNVSRGDIVRANGAVVALPESGQVCVYTSLASDLLVDVSGYFSS